MRARAWIKVGDDGDVWEIEFLIGSSLEKAGFTDTVLCRRSAMNSPIRQAA